MYYSVNILKSLMVYITPQPSSKPWRILHKTLLLYTTLWIGVFATKDEKTLFLLLLILFKIVGKRNESQPKTKIYPPNSF